MTFDERREELIVLDLLTVYHGLAPVPLVAWAAIEGLSLEALKAAVRRLHLKDEVERTSLGIYYAV